MKTTTKTSLWVSLDGVALPTQSLFLHSQSTVGCLIPLQLRRGKVLGQCLFEQSCHCSPGAAICVSAAFVILKANSELILVLCVLLFLDSALHKAVLYASVGMNRGNNIGALGFHGGNTTVHLILLFSDQNMF